MSKNDRIKRLEDEVYGREGNLTFNWRNWFSGGEWHRSMTGLNTKVRRLEKENEKLKAIVAELCDEVYSK